jgi:hypothetical protein
MLKNRLYILLILASVIFISACDSIENSVTPDEIQNIKSISKWNADVNSSEKLNLIQYQEFDINGKLLRSELYHQNGVVSESSEFSYDGNKGTELTIKYDENGSKTGQQFCENTYENERLITKKMLNENGEVLKVVEYNYNQQGRVIKTIEKNHETGNQTSTQFNYQFNNNGNLVERVVIDNDGTVQRDSLNYLGDINSIEVINISDKGDVNLIRTFVYDDFGKIISEIESTTAGEIRKKIIYEYTYQ